jgi:hypothetical protein
MKQKTPFWSFVPPRLDSIQVRKLMSTHDTTAGEKDTVSYTFEPEIHAARYANSPSILSATVWALGYMTQVPSHLLSLTG